MISRAIKSLYPNATFAVDNEDYSTIRWVNAPDPVPTLEQLQIEIENLKQQDINLSYKALRRPEYPSLQEFADAYYWSQRGDDTKMTAWLTSVDSVKSKYPKK
jgi:hypothetical protein